MNSSRHETAEILPKILEDQGKDATSDKGDPRKERPSTVSTNGAGGDTRIERAEARTQQAEMRTEQVIRATDVALELQFIR